MPPSRWPAYSAALLLAVGIACLIALVIKSPADGGSSAVAKHKPSTGTTVAMPAKTSADGAPRSS